MIAAARTTNPFPGLRPYESSESGLFFGRDEQIDALLAHLRLRRFVAVVGVSGSGKSSLVRAGLVPALERGYLTGARSEWRITTLRPGGDPMGELARNTAAALGIPEAEARVELARSSLGLADLARRYLSPQENLLLVVDQFEELFRFHKEAVSREEREASAAFVKLLLTAAGRPEVPAPDLDDLPVFVVLTMRSDYLGKSSQFRGLPEALNESQYLTPRMTRGQLEESIEGPVGMAGARIAPRLVQRLLNDAGDSPDQLPVLQHALMRTWEVSGPARSQGEPIDLPHYEDPAVGTMSKTLNLDADRAFGALGGDPRKSEIARWVFQRLVEPGAKDEESRRPTHLTELAAVCEASADEVRAAIAPFCERGFLVFSNERDPFVDISHESLIRLWDNLTAWVTEESGWASTYTRLADWVKDDFPPYTGLALDQALHWQEIAKPNAVWAQRYRSGETTFDRSIDFLKRSQQAREDALRMEEGRRRTELRHARLLAIVVGVAFVVAVVFGAYAYLQRGEAQKQAASATSERLATAGLINKVSHLDLAALLSIEGRQVEDGFEARNSLLLSLQANPGLVSLLHHPSSLFSAGFSPDGKLLASASGDKTVRLWDVARRQPLGDPLAGHSGQVFGVAFSPDGKLLASASADKTVRLWDVARRQPLGEPLTGHVDAVYSVAFSPDGKLLASASGDKTVRLWDVARRQPLGEPLTGHVDAVYSVAFSPDGKLLASASGDKTVRLWDMARRRPLGDPLTGHSGQVFGVAFGPDSKVLASASADNAVRLWDVARRRPLGEPLTGHFHAVYGVAFSPDGKLLASASLDRTVRLWDVARRQPLGEPLSGHSDAVRGVAFSADGKLLASASLDNTVRLWDVVGRQLGEPLSGHSDAVRGVAFSPDGKLLASASFDKTVRLWNVAPRLPLGDPLTSHLSVVNGVAFSPDGNLLASASADNTVRLWDVARRHPLGEPLTGHSFGVSGVAFSPDGKLLASASFDKTVRLWDVARRQPLGDPLTGHSEVVSSVAFSPDGKLLASASWDHTVRLWDVARRQPLGEPLTGHLDAVYSVAFSPDGKLLASASGDKTVRLWDVARRQPLGDPLTGHSFGVSGVAFSPDGKLLASASGDKTVRLWDVARRQPLGDPLTGHSEVVNGVAFSPDGKLLASADDDQTIRLWDVDPSSWASYLCRLANRNLSITEWQQYIGPNAPYRRTCLDLPPGEGAPRR